MADVLAPAVAFAFYGTVMVLAVAEVVCPWRVPATSLGRRWLTNIGLFVGNQALLLWVMPATVIVIAHVAAAEGAGLLNAAPVPDAVAVLVGMLILDLYKYIEHRLSHAVPVLWRMHRVHHSDVDVDFTTAQRHHPLETLFGAGGMLVVVYVFGVPPLAAVLYVMVAGSVALLSHANLRLPEAVDRLCRLLIVTPATHGVHHSARRTETDSNFGQVLTVWDRLFATYRTPTEQAERARVLGLEYFRDDRDARLDRVLLQPFRSPSASTPAPAACPGSATPLPPLAG